MSATIRAGLFKAVLNLYDWLPPQGEVRTALRYAGADLCVDVFFENDNDTIEQLKTIVFSGVCCFYISSIPGVNLLAIEFNKVASSGDLVEYEESEAARIWSEHLQYQKIRHFEVYFLSDNRRLEVFAEAFRLLE